ncbi:E3 ubiquitin-protein ligase RNF25-like isoform X2 [Dreissena polymorpha]|nr:E3 ubiquitin-protein ligase RNF25-like isoform X2 [Dreissena polymorpha]
MILQLTPATGEDLDKMFVCMTLLLDLPHQYPDIPPEFTIKNPRGIGEEEIQSLVEDMHALCEERRGGPVLYELIELAKESLTAGNTPHCACMICLEHFLEGEKFTRTQCYHYFHESCLGRYVQHALNKTPDTVPAHTAVADLQRNKLLCPVCREEISYSAACEDVSSTEQVPPFILTSELRAMQQAMSAAYERQRALGGIIDLEAEKNKYLVKEDDVVLMSIPKSDGITMEAESTPGRHEEQDKQPTGRGQTAAPGASRGANGQQERTHRKDTYRSNKYRPDRYNRGNKDNHPKNRTDFKPRSSEGSRNEGAACGINSRLTTSSGNDKPPENTSEDGIVKSSYDSTKQDRPPKKYPDKHSTGYYSTRRGSDSTTRPVSSKRPGNDNRRGYNNRPSSKPNCNTAVGDSDTPEHLEHRRLDVKSDPLHELENNKDEKSFNSNKYEHKSDLRKGPDVEYHKSSYHRQRIFERSQPKTDILTSATEIQSKSEVDGKMVQDNDESHPRHQESRHRRKPHNHQKKENVQHFERNNNQAEKKLTKLPKSNVNDTNIRTVVAVTSDHGASPANLGPPPGLSVQPPPGITDQAYTRTIKPPPGFS